MHRIIRRIVTIVTTTTWTISWNDAAQPSAPEPDPNMDSFSSPKDSNESVQRETKEVDVPKTDPVANQADQPPETPS
jgi:hypothetical protein